MNSVCVDYNVMNIQVHSNDSSRYTHTNVPPCSPQETSIIYMISKILYYELHERVNVYALRTVQFVMRVK